MSNDLTKKAVEMLLKGATLLAEPCPYCKGVRILKDGDAFCVSCGRAPQTSKTEESSTGSNNVNSMAIFEKKLEILSKELELEKDHKKQQQILDSINLLIDTINRLKKQQ